MGIDQFRPVWIQKWHKFGTRSFLPQGQEINRYIENYTAILEMYNSLNHMTDTEIKLWADTFFEQPPETGPGSSTVKSVLFLLRRDLRDLSVAEQKIPSIHSQVTAPVAASFVILVGFEILARIWWGKNDITQKQFASALEKILKVSAETAALLVEFRNAIGHGYSMELLKKGANRRYYFTLVDDVRHSAWFRAVEIDTGLKYIINFWDLRAQFLRALKRLYSKFSNSGNRRLKTNFEKSLYFLKPYHIYQSS